MRRLTQGMKPYSCDHAAELGEEVASDRRPRSARRAREADEHARPWRPSAKARRRAAPSASGRPSTPRPAAPSTRARRFPSRPSSAATVLSASSVDGLPARCCAGRWSGPDVHPARVPVEVHVHRRSGPRGRSSSAAAAFVEPGASASEDDQTAHDSGSHRGRTDEGVGVRASHGLHRYRPRRGMPRARDAWTVPRRGARRPSGGRSVRSAPGASGRPPRAAHARVRRRLPHYVLATDALTPQPVPDSHGCLRCWPPSIIIAQSQRRIQHRSFSTLSRRGRS